MRRVLLAGLLLASVRTCDAASGAAFLKAGAGARPAAMGHAYTAIADDVDSLYYNPGGLSRLTRPEIGATHAQWLLGASFDFIGYVQPTAAGTWGVSVTRLATGTQEARGADRRREGGFAASDTAYALSFGRKAGRSNGLGATVKFLESRIGSDSASTVAFDLGAVHRTAGRRWSFGAAALNIGRGLRFNDQIDPLPLTLGVGAAFETTGLLRIALDVRYEPNDRRTDIGIGTEYALMRGFTLRAGYALPSAGAGISPVGFLSGLGGGLGVRLGRYRADYTFTPFGALGDVSRVSLGVRF